VWSDQGNKSKGTKKASWHWEEIYQQAFDLIKTTIACDVVLAYPDYSKSLRYMLTPLNPKLAQSLLRKTNTNSFL
jgi:hypothetical protein